MLLDPRSIAALVRSGLLTPVRPHRAAAMVAAALRHGLTPTAALAASAARSPDRAALVDDESTTTYAELDRRCDAAAVLLSEHGVTEHTVVGLLGDSSRRYVEAMLAAGRLGTDVVYLNTGFSAEQVADTLEREHVSVLLHDPELAAAARVPAIRLDRAWDTAVAERLGERPARVNRRGRQVILTSGTSGRPKGAPRETSSAFDPFVALLSVIPLRAERTVVVAAPLFHAWGWAHVAMALLLRSTVVVTRSRQADAVLDLLERSDADTVVTVPVLLGRLVDAACERESLPRPRVVAVSGSALPGSVATAFMDLFGDCLYNLYGATEVGWVSVATPADLRADPSTAGRPVRGIVLRLLGADERDVAAGEVGRIAVETGLEMDAYTDGSARPRAAGLLLTGDLGRLDAEGRLQVVGRADDMVVSGGENVYPSGVEDLLAAYPGIADVAVVGVDDDVYGQRLRAVVVAEPGAELDPEAIREHVRHHRARHEVPREVVVVDALPRNAAGKILRRDLRH